jgi:D-alanine--poly(phosphoribitol) ligase subunit 1
LSNFNNSLLKKIKNIDSGSIPKISEISGDNGAYIMFTSGSTGFPKGVLITHNNLINFIAWSSQEFNIREGECATNLNPLFFDNSVFDFYTTIFNGATLAPIAPELVKDPAKLIKKIDDLKCTQWFSVPSLLIYIQAMKGFNKDNMKSIKRFIFGGEGFPKSKLKPLFDLYKDKASFYNVYGPTECTCICSSYTIQNQDFKSLVGLPPLGKIINNFDYLILNQDEKVDKGGVGELCLIGPCVGIGYYGDKHQTDKSFVQNPLESSFRQIVYKTGDIVTVDKESNYLHFVARKDNQIKHMGYRIELEEIESAANSIDYINEAVALHICTNDINRIYLVVSINTEIEVLIIKSDLRKIIPEYMIPTKIKIIDTLPKNSNGKIDRKVLENFTK